MELPLIIFGVIAVVALLAIWFVLSRFWSISEQWVGIKERRYFGTKCHQGRVVATEGEVGIQAEVLKPGLHFVFSPFDRIAQKNFHWSKLVQMNSELSKRLTANRCLEHNFAPDKAQNAHNNFKTRLLLSKWRCKRYPTSHFASGKWAIHPYLFRVSIAKVTVIPPGKSWDYYFGRRKTTWSRSVSR